MLAQRKAFRLARVDVRQMAASAGRNVAMFLLGAALAPTYPLVLAGFFARAGEIDNDRTPDQRLPSTPQHWPD